MSLIPEKAIPEDMQVIHLIAARLDTFHSDMQEIKGVQKEMAAAFSRLVLMEERQTNTAAAIERAFKLQEKLEEKIEASRKECQVMCAVMEGRIDTLEKDAPTNKRTSDWVFMGVIGFIALVAPKLIERLF